MKTFKYYEDDYCIDVMKEDLNGNYVKADDFDKALELLKEFSKELKNPNETNLKILKVKLDLFLNI